MTHPIDRRTFLGSAASTGLAWGLAGRSARAGERAASETLVVGVMGMGGRGTSLASTFQQQPGVEVACVCDVDEGRARQAAGAVERAGGSARPVIDFRRILDDDSVDVLVIATCNHWHAPAAILGCAAGKHVYVEKPCSHNPREGELMVEAARKFDRRVQMGAQRRSWPKVIEAIERVQSGDAIGRAYFAQSWYGSVRPSIGRGEEAPVPSGLDYALWQGPAPHRPFRTNYLHYNWHWFWHWGNGELGNNGIHMIDLCRWGLDVDYPVRVTSAGGRYRYDDDQETPDTHQVAFDFDGGKSIAWQGLSCVAYRQGMVPDALFHGERGTLAIVGGGYVIYDDRGREVETVGGPGGDVSHVTNFLEAIRSGAPLTSEIEEAHKSTLLCHLGNIAHRVGRSLACDPVQGRIRDDSPAMQLWSREYAEGWEPRV